MRIVGDVTGDEDVVVNGRVEGKIRVDRKVVVSAGAEVEGDIQAKSVVVGGKVHGQVMASEALESVATATTVRVRNGKLSVTDGPFAETKEQLAGFYLVEARDLNEAISLAAKIPPARLGSVEVRPIRPIRTNPRN